MQENIKCQMSVGTDRHKGEEYCLLQFTQYLRRKTLCQREKNG